MTTEPLSRREMTEALRKDRGATKRYVAVQLVALDERIAEIERRMYATPPPRGWRQSYADEQAATFDRDPDE